MTSTVIIVTLDRPDCVRRCLTSLSLQTHRPEQVIVVDASRDQDTRHVVEEFENVLYLRNENGFGRMTASRNIGLLHSTGELIAFVDDDAFPHRTWLEQLRKAYDADDIGAVGGRVLDGQGRAPGPVVGADDIGKLKSDGHLYGHFDNDPGRVIDIDHMMGCNMSFRRHVLAELGGFREDYPGISGLREDSDMSLRVGAAGYRLRFAPAAAVDHLGAPQSVGRRFDHRYMFFSQRNHIVLLARNRGLLSPVLWKHLLVMTIDQVKSNLRRLAAIAVNVGVYVLGTLAGFGSALAILSRSGRDPRRHDADAERLRAALRSAPESIPDSEQLRISPKPANVAS